MPAENKRWADILERIAARCEALGISEAEALRRAKLNRSQLSDMRAGNEPRIGAIRALAKVLDVTVAWLTGEDEPRRDPGRFPVFDTGRGSNWGVPEDAERNQENRPDNLVGFRVRGDSMEPIARDGQLVLIEKGAPVKDGDLAIVELKDGTRSFKRVHRKGKQVILQPVNPSHNADVVSTIEVAQMTRIWGVKF